MRVPYSAIINLPVYTADNVYIGRIKSFDIIADTQTIATYYVRTAGIRGLWRQQLMIAPTQVVQITKDRMIVESTITPISQAMPVAVSSGK